MADDLTLRIPESKVRPPRRLQNALGAGAVTASGGILYEVVPIFGAQSLTVRIKTATNGGTIDIVLVGPDFPPKQSVAAFSALIGTKYTTGNPTQVAVTAGTEAVITTPVNGESYAIVKFTGTVGAGAISYCDVDGLGVTGVIAGAGAPVATQLAITQQPATTQVQGVALTQQIVVEIRDASGAKVSTSTAAVTVTLNAQSTIGGTLSGTATVNAVAGVATFAGLSIDNVDTYSLTAASSGLTSATSSVFTNGGWSKFIAAVPGGTTSFDYITDYLFNTVLAAGKLTTNDDIRGSSFAPTNYPGGTPGGTPAPAVTAGVLDTTLGYAGNAANDAKYRFDQSDRPEVVIGEFPTFTDYWGGKQNGGSLFEFWRENGTSKLAIFNTNTSVPFVQPGAGIRSVFLKYWWKQSFESTGRIWLEKIGHGINANGHDNTTTTGRMLWGTAPAGSNRTTVKIRACFGLNIPWTATIRAALDVLLVDANLGLLPSTFASSDSVGNCPIIGDSFVAGNTGTGITTSITTPIQKTATFFPAYVQAAVDTASKPIDCYALGTGGYTLAQLLADGVFDRACGHMSALRRAAGFFDGLVSQAATNDLAAGATALAIEANVTTIVGKVHAAGGKIVLVTVIPRGGFYTTAKEAERLALNAWYRTNSVGADAIADPCANAAFADPSGGSDTITTNLAFYTNDGIHPNSGGTAVYGPIVGAAVVSIA